MPATLSAHDDGDMDFCDDTLSKKQPSSKASAPKSLNNQYAQPISQFASHDLVSNYSIFWIDPKIKNEDT